MVSLIRCLGAWVVAVGAGCLVFPCPVLGHVVPSMTMEVEFLPDHAFRLRANVDPRLILAVDPATLPPVPASWYREQTQEQVTATHQKAFEYLDRVLGLLFDGKRMPLPKCKVQAIDGADNNPLRDDTQEVHLLASVDGRAPDDATGFQLDFGKDANTSLILLQSHAGKADPRPQVVFPGETSRVFPLQAAAKRPVSAPPSPDSGSGRYWVWIVAGVVLVLLIQSWRLLNRHRHHHRGHRKPGG